MEIFVFLMPLLISLVLGLLIGAAVTQYMAPWLALAGAVGLGVTAAVLVWIARSQSEMDAIGNVVLGTLVAAPAGLGMALGAVLILWRRSRG